MSDVTVLVRRLPHGDGAAGPVAEIDACRRRRPRRRGARGRDADHHARAARALVPTGFAIAIPAGFEGQVRPRSGLAAEHGVTVLNAPGTIDADYRGELKVILVNHGDRAVRDHAGHADRPARDRAGDRGRLHGGGGAAGDGARRPRIRLDRNRGVAKTGRLTR